MENKFDKDLKQRLGEASLPESGLRLDKDKLWNKIEKKRSGKRIAFLPWISHVAAMAAGLAAGIFMFVHNDQPETNQPVIVQHQEAPVVKRVTDTVYIAKNEKEQIKQPSALGKTTKAPLPAPAPVQQPDNITTDDRLRKKEMQPMIAMNKPVPVKVLHLADIDNENAQPHIRAQEKPSFFVAFPDRNPSGPGTETLSALLTQKLNPTKH